MFLGAFVKNRIVFALLRLICGMGGMGCYMVSAVIAAEGTLPTHKIYTTMVVSLAFPIGELVLTLEAYFIRDWYTLQIISHAPMLLLLGLYFLLPESTRWLLANGRIAEAKNGLHKRAGMTLNLSNQNVCFNHASIEY